MTTMLPEIARVRILVVGFGSAGRRHVKNLLTLGVREISVCSEFRKLPDVVVDGFPLRTVHTFEEGLNSRPHAVILANPTAHHPAYLGQALHADCDVYVEKPLGEARASLEPLKGLVSRSERVVAVGNQMRFSRGLQYVRKILGESVLGRVLHVHIDMGEYLPNYHPEEDYRQSYAAIKALGGGVLLTQIHDINYLHWLFGRFESVLAVGGKVSDLEIDVEDSVSFLLKRGTFAVSVHMDYLQRNARRNVTITGELGTMTWDYHYDTVTLRKAEEVASFGGPVLNRNEMFLDAMADFLRCRQSGESPRTDFEGGLQDVVVVDSIRSSLNTNTVTEIKYE